MRENAYTAPHTHVSKLHVCTTKQTSALCGRPDQTDARACATDCRQKFFYTCEHYVIRGDTITRIVLVYICKPNIVVVNVMHISPVEPRYHLLNK